MDKLLREMINEDNQDRFHLDDSELSEIYFDRIHLLSRWINYLKSPDISFLIYGLLNLEFIWNGRFTTSKLYREKGRLILDKLLEDNLIKYHPLTRYDIDFIEQKLNVRPCAIATIKLYDLTFKGRELLSEENISLLIQSKLSYEQKKMIEKERLLYHNYEYDKLKMKNEK